MQIEYVLIHQINPAKYNPRTITDQELSGLKESIKKFGFVEPLIVNKRTNTLTGGHQRLKAAELLGYDKVPVTYVDLSVAEEKALNVALNSHTIQGKFDLEILPTLLEEIKIELPDLDLNFDKLQADLGILFKDQEIEDDDAGENLDKKYILEIQFYDSESMNTEYERLIGSGLSVRVK